MPDRIPRIVFMDIETTSLDADSGILIGVGLAKNGGKPDFLFIERPEDEPRLIKEALRRIKDCNILITWHGKSFDIPFLVARTLKFGEDASSLSSMIHLDLAEFVRNNLRLGRTDLYHVSKFLGFGKDIEVTGLDMPRLYLSVLKKDRRAKAAIRKHCLDDLKATGVVFNKLRPLIRAQKPELLL